MKNNIELQAPTHWELEEISKKIDHLTDIFKAVFNVESKVEPLKSNPTISFYNKNTRRYEYCKLRELDIRLTDLPVRAKNTLQQIGIEKVGDIEKVEKSVLLKHRNFGTTSMSKLEKFMDKHNLKLKDEN